ncbi:hypothetical protein Emed_003925 [Eimeria media]
MEEEEDMSTTSPLKASMSTDAMVSDIYGHRRTPVAFARRMYMNRAKMHHRRTSQWRRVSGDINHASQEAPMQPSKGLGKDAKGLVVHFGHESWNMVINIMVGIRLAGGRAMSEPHRNVEPYDFVMKEKFSVLPKTGMVDKKQTSLCAVRFIDYAPMVFRRIRAIFGIDSLLYIRSVGPEQLLGNLILGNLSSLSELVSEGKSGSLFYYTTDGRFMIKTVSKETASFMRSILFDYYKHVSTCTNTMLTRFCGLHAIRLKDKSGQILGRKEPWRRKTYFMIEIGQERKKLFIDQLALDATFLRDHDIMDYSLLLGISYANRSQDSNICHDGVFQINEDMPGSHSLLESSAASASAPGSDFERPFWNKDLGGMHSSDRTKLYYVGIIDILTHWNAKKKLEHVARVLQTGNSSGASCVNPSVYSQRFVDFIACHTV